MLMWVLLLPAQVERKRKALEEATKKDDKGRVPIGGIRMPGFLQRRGKDKGKVSVVRIL